MRWLALCLVLAGCGQSCEERGGIEVYMGTTTVIQNNGKFFYPVQYQIYECVTKEKNNG